MPPLTLANIARRAEAYQSLDGVSGAVKVMCAAISRAALAEASDENSEQEVEGDFISSLSFAALIDALPLDGIWQWCNDLISRRFSTSIVVTPVASTAGKRSKRVGAALIARMLASGTLEMPRALEVFVEQYEAHEKRMTSQFAGNISAASAAESAAAKVHAGLASPEGVVFPPAGSSSVAPQLSRQESDITRHRRAVQSHFADGQGERSRFTGDLAKEPSFDLWEKRYRALVSHLGMSEADKVLLLSEALSSAALTFFYSTLCPAAARAGDSLAEAITHASTITNLAPNISTLSGAFAALEGTFCTESARNVLKQELDQLSLSQVESEEQLSKPLALVKLKERIQQLSCNGPVDFRSESCMVAAFKKCLAGELWAVDPLVNANDRASKNPRDRTLEHYCQTLVSYLREKENLGGQSSGMQSRALGSAVVPKMTHGLADAYYGDARAMPRHTRTSYRHQMAPRRGTSYDGGSAGSSSLPQGPELRRMLAQGATSRKPGLERAQFPGDMSRNCWNCGKPGHLSKDCRQPRRPRVDIARAMLSSNVSPMEVAVWMSRDSDELTSTILSSVTEQKETEEVHEGVEDDPIDFEEEDPTQVFDALMASISRSSEPTQHFH